MSIEERALSAFIEANPIPDPESLENDLMAGYLTDLQRRSTEMTQTDRRQRQTGPTGRRRPVAAIVAVALTVVGIVMIGIIASNGGDQSPDVVVPTPTTVETPTTQPEAVVTPTEVTPETIVGLWGRVPAGVMEIRADGLMRIVSVGNQDLELTDELLDQAGSHTSGNWVLDGDVLTFSSDGTGTLCDAGATATMTLSFQGTSLIVSDVTDDPCGSPELFNQSGRFPGKWTDIGDAFGN